MALLRQGLKWEKLQDGKLHELEGVHIAHRLDTSQVSKFRVRNIEHCKMCRHWRPVKVEKVL